MLALLAGCKKKQTNVPPPNAQAPTITQPETQPAQQPAAAPPTEAQPQAATAPEKPPETTTAPSSTTSNTTEAPAPKPKPRWRRPSIARKKNQTQKNSTTTAEKPAPSQPTTSSQSTQATNNAHPALPSSSSPESAPPPLNPNVPQNEVAHDRQTTEQLLQSTENNLKNIRRQLSTDEQEMVRQIRNYMQQSRAATNDGDTVRARTLALKAHQLSDALVTQ
jgi:hypothetical protein